VAWPRAGECFTIFAEWPQTVATALSLQAIKLLARVGHAWLPEKKTVRIFGEEVPVNAEIHSLEGMSAHADAQQVVDWLKTCPTKPRQVFLTHGEPGPADMMRQRIERSLGWNAFAPLLGQQIEVQ